MTIENGTAIVLAYVLVSMGVIIAFLLAAFVIGWFRSAARAPLRTARRRVTYRAVLTSGPESPATGTSSGHSRLRWRRLSWRRE